MDPSRHDLSFPCSRRSFWRALLQECFVTLDSLNGGRGIRLSDLGSLPDHELAEIKPGVNPDWEISMEDGHVCGQSRRTQVRLKLFPMEKANLTVFNLCNGRHNLGEIGHRLSEEMGWKEDQGFEHARDLFLSLVSQLVCIPTNPPDSEQ